MGDILHITYWDQNTDLARVEITDETKQPRSASYICERHEVGQVKSRLVCDAYTWASEQSEVGNIFHDSPDRRLHRPDLGDGAVTA